MPRFEPFVGLRYDTPRVDMNMVIAPPYDVIERPERKRLAGRHSANAVRVELPEPDHRAGLDQYANARAMLDFWQEAGTLVADPEPSFYAYRMTSPSGRSTNGIIGALAIDEDSVGDILPHEQTLPKPKSDRLDLLRATRVNLSPIWGLSLTSGLTEAFASTMSAGPAQMTATDDDGVVHQLWVIDDQATIDAVGKAVGSSPVVVADGHHRYETALTYRRELAEQNETLPGADLIMALVVELSDDQLEVGPVHRVLSGLPEGIDLVDAFSSWFNVTKVGDLSRRTLTALGESQALALVMASGAWLLSPKDGTPEAAGAELDSSMVALVIAELPDHELEFCYSWQDAAEAISSERAQAVVLLRPATVGQISEWAHSNKRMPPKTTYFHPKPRTGMVFRPLSP
ncbi:MAG TPA: DUF1015 domain-containing protein [Acidimicrobiales bacterium]|nr:DUF1015 domain-containing protein [Acidimicrobiales bacterium]